MDIKKIIYEYFDPSISFDVKEIKSGAINQTFILVVDGAGNSNRYILQKMKEIFSPEIMHDIDFISNHIASKGILIQSVIKTKSGDNHVKDDNSWWRLLSYIPGRTHDSLPSVLHAKEAGELLGKFHIALLDCKYDFKFNLPHFFDTDFTINKLKNVLEKNKKSKKYNDLNVLALEVISEYNKLPKDFYLPKRIIHGDLKFSNVLFNEKGDKAIALIDLDTLMHSNVAFELGDALRSWSMPGGEDAETVIFDSNIYNNALEGYFSVAKFLTQDEKNSISFGVKIVTLELASRFIIDAFEEKYWVLNKSKYKNLYEQNKKKAENQLEFYRQFKQYKN